MLDDAISLPRPKPRTSSVARADHNPEEKAKPNRPAAVNAVAEKMPDRRRAGTVAPPAKAPRNFAKKRLPAAASVSPQALLTVGRMGPRRTVPRPASRKPAASQNVDGPVLSASRTDWEGGASTACMTLTARTDFA